MSIQADGSGNKAVTTTSTGLAKDTGTPITPAPIRRAAPDSVSSPRAPQNSRSGLGLNGYAGASSLESGTFTRSPLADNMVDSVNDPVLGEILSKGTARSNTTGETMAPQTRDVGKSGLPDAMGMESARARQPSSAKFSAIPATLDKSTQGDPVRQPESE
jgi:hypothetical protein